MKNQQKPVWVVMYIFLMCISGTLVANSALASNFIHDKYGIWEEGDEYVGIDTWRALGENRSPTSDHPYLIDPLNMKLLLQSLETSNRNGGLVRLLTDQQAKDLGTKLSKAFVMATKKTDVIFAIENESVNGEIITGRMFYVKGRINLILGGRKSGSRPGVRAYAASEFYKLNSKLGITYLNSDRYDWAQIILESVLREPWRIEVEQEQKKEVESLLLEVKSLRKELAKREGLLNHEECPPTSITGVEAVTRINRLQHLFTNGLITEAELKALRTKVLNEI